MGECGGSRASVDLARPRVQHFAGRRKAEVPQRGTAVATGRPRQHAVGLIGQGVKLTDKRGQVEVHHDGIAIASYAGVANRYQRLADLAHCHRMHGLARLIREAELSGVARQSGLMSPPTLLRRLTEYETGDWRGW